MKLEQVIALCQLFDNAGLEFWLDGGWGVDALLGEQTRPHSDLDLAVEYFDMPKFEHVLTIEGFSRDDQPGNPEWNLVLSNMEGQSVDLHGFVFNKTGDAVLGDPAEGSCYPAGALDGIGQIGGMAVRCVSAPSVLRFRNGFEPRPVDRHDVAMLCARFSLPLPVRFL